MHNTDEVQRVRTLIFIHKLVLVVTTNLSFPQVWSFITQVSDLFYQMNRLKILICFLKVRHIDLTATRSANKRRRTIFTTRYELNTKQPRQLQEMHSVFFRLEIWRMR